MARLKSLQDQVDAKTTLEEKVATATALFNRKSPPSTFDAVRSALEVAAPPGRACFYCERDRWREIEHVRPKRFYPEHCFRWSNYVYSCTICNQDHKKDRYAVFHQDQLIEFDRTRPYSEGTPPGDHVLIDIRTENPLEYLRLDFETGGFAPIADSGRARARAEFTRELFDLDADDLRKIRQQAFRSFRNYLTEFHNARMEGDANRMSLVLSEIEDLPHPTVLVEMRRQAAANEQLASLFEGVPERIGQRP